MWSFDARRETRLQFLDMVCKRRGCEVAAAVCMRLPLCRKGAQQFLRASVTHRHWSEPRRPRIKSYGKQNRKWLLAWKGATATSGTCQLSMMLALLVGAASPPDYIGTVTEGFVEGLTVSFAADNGPCAPVVQNSSRKRAGSA